MTLTICKGSLEVPLARGFVQHSYGRHPKKNLRVASGDDDSEDER